MIRMTRVVIGALLVISTSGIPVQAQQLAGTDSSVAPVEIIPGQFIVQLRAGASQAAVLHAHGIAALRQYTIINGFVAHLSQVAASRLAADPDVVRVSPDLVVRAFARPSEKPGGGGGKGGGKGGNGGSGGGGDTGGTTCSGQSTDGPAQTVPSGVQRIGSPQAWASGITGAGIKVAVIDTGIDGCHPDLRDNYKGGINLLDTTKPPLDDFGHGTHVAGTIAASRTNNAGVVGVAPDAWLYAVKILDASGAGSLSLIIDALDWAVQNGIQVVNMSLGASDFWCVLGLCGFGSECSAISNATAAGVVVVVAAGNASAEALGQTPANCQDSVTVSAFVDSDGAAGGAGPTFHVTVGGVAYDELDDTFADSFSNHSIYAWDTNGNGVIDATDHPVIDFTAPGVAIESTLPTYPVTLNADPYNLPLDYGVLNGTSMATPHVAGAAALYLQAHPGATAEQVRLGLVGNAECPGAFNPTLTQLCAAGWPDDPDLPDVWEPLVHAGDPAP